MVWGSKGTRVWQLLMVQESAMTYVDEKNTWGEKLYQQLLNLVQLFRSFQPNSCAAVGFKDKAYTLET